MQVKPNDVLWGYRVHSSKVETVPAGTLMIDKADSSNVFPGQSRHYELYDGKTGKFSDGWTSLAVAQLCTSCYLGMKAAEHHDGPCSDAPRWNPAAGGEE